MSGGGGRSATGNINGQCAWFLLLISSAEREILNTKTLKRMEQLSVRVALVLLAAAFLASTSTMVAVSARYLPTRSQEDRLERLRELLKDLFDSDYDHRTYPLADVSVLPERAAIFKRSAGLAYAPGVTGHDLVKGLRNGALSSSAALGGNGLVQLPSAMLDSPYADPERKLI
ncbi:hypothetical protein Ocin01_00738 [Orchesella cincta]|uniref:Uncharacterized protein n=1 Tax=Orchesella cincta TaxID=48709 RepID=A0A1D2NLE9_ORCCI|nr:hypothetical protein Ocin01_00738 [Orchesella cincta]